MKKSFLLFGFVTLIFLACERNEPQTPINPLNGKTTAIFNSAKKYGTVEDVDGNVYKTIVIGGQTWMAENLRTVHYRNGDVLPNSIDSTQWASLNTGAYCNYNNTTNLDTIATFGRLYNWYAVADSRNISPKGWRVPTIADWDILFSSLGGDSIASNKMKEVGITHWEDPFHSDNSCGFTALPGGRRYLTKKFEDMGFFGVWWTSSEYNEITAGFFYLYYFDSLIWKGINFKNNGYALRCIKE
jgi:uncharacterized protein (TIGR02145 family)